MSTGRHVLGLLTTPGSYAIDCLTACTKLPLAAVDLSRLGVQVPPCPYDLPVIRSGQRVIVGSGWLSRLRQQGVDVVGRVLPHLREEFQLLIGFDHADPFQLDFTNEEIDMMDLVLKVNGLYRDDDLYDYLVGAPTPDGRWTQKTQLRQTRYSRSNLDKIRLSIPCFFGVSPGIRAMTRRLYVRSSAVRLGRSLGDRLLNVLPRPPVANRPPKHTVHFLASLTHIQRLTAVRMLRRKSLRWKGGIAGVPEFVTGLKGVGMTRLASAERQALAAELSSEGVMTSSKNRLTYQLGMSDCKAILSITGYGELCFRMAEAWANRRVLVCQDLSHVRTPFPFERGRNVVYCRPDLADLIDVLDDIECNFRKYVDIAERGYRDWTRWSNDPEKVMQECFAPLYATSDPIAPAQNPGAAAAAKA